MNSKHNQYVTTIKSCNCSHDIVLDDSSTNRTLKVILMNYSCTHSLFELLHFCIITTNWLELFHLYHHFLGRRPRGQKCYVIKLVVLMVKITLEF